MHLVRCLAFITASNEFYPKASHIKGANNILADAPLFRSLYPPEPTSILYTHPLEARLDVKELVGSVDFYF